VKGSEPHPRGVEFCNEEEVMRILNPYSSRTDILEGLQISNLGAPKPTGNEPLFSSELENVFLFPELTAYPQRSALEPLLTID
jgi:hypothetical protein